MLLRFTAHVLGRVKRTLSFCLTDYIAAEGYGLGRVGYGAGWVGYGAGWVGYGAGWVGYGAGWVGFEAELTGLVSGGELTASS